MAKRKMPESAKSLIAARADFNKYINALGKDEKTEKRIEQINIIIETGYITSVKSDGTAVEKPLDGYKKASLAKERRELLDNKVPAEIKKRGIAAAKVMIKHGFTKEDLLLAGIPAKSLK